MAVVISFGDHSICVQPYDPMGKKPRILSKEHDIASPQVAVAVSDEYLVAVTDKRPHAVARDGNDVMFVRLAPEIERSV